MEKPPRPMAARVGIMIRSSSRDRTCQFFRARRAARWAAGCAGRAPLTAPAGPSGSPVTGACGARPSAGAVAGDWLGAPESAPGALLVRDRTASAPLNWLLATVAHMTTVTSLHARGTCGGSDITSRTPSSGQGSAWQDNTAGKNYHQLVGCRASI